jgi:hypothetical protein
MGKIFTLKGEHLSKVNCKLGTVAHICNPSYSGGGDQGLKTGPGGEALSERLPSMREALSSNPSTAEKKEA